MDARHLNQDYQVFLKISMGDGDGRLAKSGLTETMPASGGSGSPLFVFTGDENVPAELNDPSKWKLAAWAVAEEGEGNERVVYYSALRDTRIN